MTERIVPGERPVVPPEDLGTIEYDGAPITREILEENPGLITAIENVTGIIVNMETDVDG